MIPRATYRLQLTREFPFAAAEDIVPYLAALGVSHVYASPITMARSGSTHGYDVIDPTRINPELGGESGFRSLVAALRARGMGIVIDIVPNHMGVAGGENPYWNDVLRLGPDSPYAGWFDIDWQSGPLVLPLLGAPLTQAIEDGDLRLSAGNDPHLLLYGDQRLPLKPGSLEQEPDELRRLLDMQHYRLVHWRAANDLLNWRRFFSINDLAGLRIEDAAIFHATHRLYFDLFGEGLIDGVRVDHVDGLSDPAAYCRSLRAAFDAIRSGPDRAYIVVEKILAADEPLSPDWGVDGTSGYDFMSDMTALLHDPSGEAPLRALWRNLDPDHGDPARVVLEARRDMLSWQFEGQLAACVAAFAALAGSARTADAALEAVTPAMIRRAIERLLWVFPVYRTYGDGRAAPMRDATVRERAWNAVQPYLPPGEAEVARHILDWLGGTGPGDADCAAEAVRRFQQLSAPIAAKGVEDTAFYRYAPLLSANDVGADPERFTLSPEEFHRRVQARAEVFPHAMLATATHDHKRGEDVRARLAVLSAVPRLWEEAVGRWSRMADECGADIHPADRYQLFQTLFGAWPASADQALPEDFPGRISGWLEKSLREARLRSSWEQPEAGYEADARKLLHHLLAKPEFTQDMGAFVARLLPAARADSLVQTALKFTLPGVPDIYQGSELEDLSLVDPDNRRPVDYARRLRLLDEGDVAEGGKMVLIQRLLRYRKEHPDLFALGSYRPLCPAGPRAAHMFAFERRHAGVRLCCAVMIRCGRILTEQGALPPAQWWSDSRLEGEVDQLAAEMFASTPYFINLSE
ncbi:MULTISPECIES: malto-oligosyltrehalose synthase [Sphingobium]|jgi:(1->4)-alpha-D-glucan 1-alpha-D-glucosylmutase|uniref:malto-oligosyltrehalose synthase n=1 Tax=Sphingobium TaxID=165695 RepID=UPI0010F6395F|nr:malto-oligosyltrehalose synthase [Sphingobium sp. RSMS]UXC93509.1 malto-oligosyltrehalose synthase [Sphingobium sp. RSMS]